MNNYIFIINAFVHNDYTSEVPPVVEIFSDRIQITSYGGLVNGLSKEDFFECRSMPRNRELMRVFKDLDLVEQLGSGMERILKTYDESSFKITPNFLVVTFMFSEPISNIQNDIVNVGVNDVLNVGVNDVLNKNEVAIMNLLKLNPGMTTKDMGEKLNVSTRTIERAVANLKKLNIIERVGSDKTGYWIIK